MSDTRREVDYGWGPENPDWPKDGKFFRGPAYRGEPVEQQVSFTKSKKHQTKDRSGPQSKKNHRFIKGVKNTRANLLKKIERLRDKEARE
jgi:hypothetical protein